MHEDLGRVLNEVDDPELGIGIVDLGLIYRAEWTEAGIEVDFTTTVRSCPYAAFLREKIDTILRERFREASSILVRLVFDPPWNLDRLTENPRIDRFKNIHGAIIHGSTMHGSTVHREAPGADSMARSYTIGRQRANALAGNAGEITWPVIQPPTLRSR